MRMSDLQRDHLRRELNAESVRRLLIKYFVERGYTNFDRPANPTMIQDLTLTIPYLETKLDIEPHALEIDPTTGKAILGWNLFVLGNQRLFLGETMHANLSELARQIKNNQIIIEDLSACRRCTTPRRIINFIERTLSKSLGGYVDLTDTGQQFSAIPKNLRLVGTATSQIGSMYTRAGYGA